jgi:hypothetical protein
VLALEESAEVLALPGDGRLVERKGALAVAEGPGVMNAPPRPVRAGEELVEHLVEDDELHEEAGDLGMVQRGVNADLPGLVVRISSGWKKRPSGEKRSSESSRS